MSKKPRLDELNFDSPTVEENLEQQRMADEILFNERMQVIISEETARNRKAKYKLFLQDVARRGISPNPKLYVDVKKRMLEKYFPGQFSPEKQDLSRQTIAQVGRIFNKIVNYSRGL